MKKFKFMYVYQVDGLVKAYYTNNVDYKQVIPAINMLAGKKVKMLERRWVGDDKDII